MKGRFIQNIPIKQIVPWKKNPRKIMKKDFERLVKQIKTLGVYKPLLVCEEGKKYVVLGGNMRLQAYKQNGIEKVDLVVVEAKTDDKKLQYNLSDNDRAGFYDENLLAEMTFDVKDKMDLSLFKVDSGAPKLDLRKLVDFFGPGDEEKEIPKKETLTTCPKCGYEW